MQQDILGLDFFTIKYGLQNVSNFESIAKEKYQLPDLSHWLNESTFVNCFMGWHKKGLFFCFDVEQMLEESFFPDFRRGDSIEIFIDTRDRKDKGFITRFCHHFIFLPQSVQQLQAKEITRFRGEDSHLLCPEKDLQVKVQINKKSYRLYGFIAASGLHGYDPSRFDKLGFTYRINRYKKPSQHFSVSSLEYVIENNPALWASLALE